MSKRFLHLLLLFIVCGLVQAADLLPPLLAFKPAVRAVDGQTIEVRFAIAKGYYLYRDNFRFAAEPSTIALGKPVLPKGKEKDDDNFGKVGQRRVHIVHQCDNQRPGFSRRLC